MSNKKTLRYFAGCVVLAAFVGVVIYGIAKPHDIVDFQHFNDGKMTTQDSERTASVKKSLEEPKLPKSGSVSPEKFDGEEESSEIQSQDCAAKIEEQMYLASSIFGVDFNVGVLSDEKETHMLFGGQRREIQFLDGTTFIFDLNTGYLACYFSIIEEEVPKGLNKNDAISKEKAENIAQKLLKDLGVEPGFEFEKIKYKGPSSIGPEGSDVLAGAEWNLSGCLKYEGIPYFPSGLKICLSAYSGAVIAYFYDPIGPPPASLEEQISPSQASTIVKDFLGIGYWDLLTGLKMPKPDKIITCGNSYFTSPGERPLVQGHTSYLCWDVIVDNGRDFPLRVFVNAATGEIIGGI